MRKQTILFIHHSTAISGAEVSLLSLVANVDKEKYKVIVMLPNKGVLYEKLLNEKLHVFTAPIVRLKKSINPIKILFYIASVLLCSISITYKLVSQNISIVHANTTNTFLYAIIPCLITRLPVIWHIRDRVPYSFICNLATLCDTSIISISNYVTPNKLKRNSNLFVIPNAVSVKSRKKLNLDKIAKYKARSKYSIGEEDLLIAQIGQLIPIKNHIDFILAAERVIEKKSNVKFLIVGSDLFNEYSTYKSDLKKTIEMKNLNNFFIFIDSQDDVMHLISIIDVLVHPSTREPFGRIIIEAMMMMVPVVAVNKGGPSEIIKNNITGYLVEPNNIDDMSLKILRLLDNNACTQKIKDQGYEDVNKRFSIACQIDKIENVYHNAIFK